MNKYMQNFKRIEKIESFKLNCILINRVINFSSVLLFSILLTSCVQGGSMYDQDEFGYYNIQGETEQQNQNTSKAADPDQDSVTEFSVSVDNTYTEKPYSIIL